MMRYGSIFVLALMAGIWPAQAQQFLIDKPVKAGELTVFPDLNDERTYYYVSDKPRLAVDANGNVQFSFLRYVENVRTGADQPEAREGEGGGIVHALVSLQVTPEQLGTAQRELQRVKAGARIQGPIVYRSGKFGLVSSFKDTQGNLTTQVLGLGNAPILDGEKAAVSIQLTKLGAKILWESFKTPAPDISFSFEMEASGFRSPHRALIEANFDQIYEHQAFGAGIASTYLAAEIKATFDDLQRKGAIKLTQIGEDEKLDALITTAYDKIASMMFSPLGGTGTPSLENLTSAAGSGGNLLDRATTMLAKSREEARLENERTRMENQQTRNQNEPQPTTPTPSGNQNAGTAADTSQARPRRYAETPPNSGGTHSRTARPSDTPSVAPAQPQVSRPAFAILAAYEMKRVRQQGIFKIDLNKYTTDNLNLRFDENIGDLSRFMGDGKHFREVNLDDPLYRQREIVVAVDGINAQDFGQYVNFVTVHLQKKHANGATSDDEVSIDRSNFNREGNNFKLLYGWKGDNDRSRWFEYEYKALWSFFGGRTVEQPLQRSTFGRINLPPPYQRRSVDLETDPDAIAAAEVRSITVKIFYDLGGSEQVKQITLNVFKNQLSDRIEFMLPADKFDYGYEITWQLRGNRTVSSGRKIANSATLFVDELP